MRDLRRRVEALERGRAVGVAFCECPFDYDRALAPLAPEAGAQTGKCERCGRARAVRILAVDMPAFWPAHFTQGA